MNTLKNIIGVLLGIIVVIALLPLIVISLPFTWISEQRFNRAYRDFLSRMDGKNFFCYNNKSKSIEFIKANVLPNLPESVEVIFLNGRTPESEYERKFIAHILYGFRNYRGFPQLLKIRNGETFDESLNNELFNVMEQNKSTAKLIERMHRFFELDEDKVDAI